MSSDVRVVAVPLKARFRGLAVREAALVEGPSGWAEWSPFAEYDAAESAAWLAAADEAAAGSWPDPVRNAVPVNATVPAVPPDLAHRIVRDSGCLTVKVKVAELRAGRAGGPAESLAADQARVEAVRDAIGPGGRIRIDANGAWDLGQARQAIAVLDRAAGGLEYVEQPCATVEELARLRRTVDVPIAADESIRRARDPYRVRDLGAADIAVLKVQPLGGVWLCLRIAEEIGMPVVVSSALETSVGLASGIALAAALPELPYACGLATAGLLADDVVADPLLPVAGEIVVRRPALDLGAAERLAADDGRRAWWMTRLAAARRVRQDRLS
ncbi:MAG: o-succinylbenzoate synthase [Nocardioides sp.]